MSSRIQCLAALIVWIAALAPALAGATWDEVVDRRGISDRFSISAGAWVKTFDSGARFDSETLGRGTEISLEDDLDLTRDQTNIRLYGYWRFNRKHRLDFGYAYWNRTSTKVLDEDIQIEEELFRIGTGVRTEWGTQVYKLAYKYSIWNNGRIEAGISAGFSTFVFDLGIQGAINVQQGGNQVNADGEVSTGDVIAPVPMLGLHADVTLVRRLFLRVSAEIFDIGYENWSVQVTDTRLTVDWFPIRHLGFGVGYNRIDLDVEKTGSESFDVNMDAHGGIVYVTYVF